MIVGLQDRDWVYSKSLGLFGHINISSVPDFSVPEFSGIRNFGYPESNGQISGSINSEVRTRYVGLRVHL